jgi:hypothetical protein
MEIDNSNITGCSGVESARNYYSFIVAKLMAALSGIRFFALWLIALIIAIATLAPLIHAVRWW